MLLWLKKDNAAKGLPSGADVDKTAKSDETSGVPTSATPPGRFVPPEPEELAKQFPQLEILELLGQGGMGAVYKARQKQLDRLVALKILPPEVGQTEAFAERFTREARSMARLNHPRIVTVYEFGHTEEGLYYFIMEFVDGTDLRRVIHAGQLGADEALAIVPQICEALQYAHEEGVVHRDIKPENIMLDKKGRVKITDFGLAKLLGRPPSTYTLTQAGHRMGTPHYMAPEQIEHPHEVDHRADIYSLGVVFYEMLTGQLPIGHFVPPSKKVQVDVRLDSVVLKTLAHEPERRYQHASEVKIDVEIIAGEAGKMPSKERQEPITEAEAALIRQSRTTKISVAIVYCIILTAWVLMPFGMFDKQGLLDIKHWELFAVSASLAWVVWFLLRRSDVKAAFRLKTKYREPGIGTEPQGLEQQGRKVKTDVETIATKSKTPLAYEHRMPAQRRFSRTAIVGACCSALALFWMPAALIYVGEIHKSDLQEFIMWVCILIGCTPVFGTTILGMVSITHIRHSAGRLYGMGLALFDALLFPLLALDVVLYLLIFISARELVRLGNIREPSLILISLLVCGVVDFLIIWWAWRKANAGLEPVQSDTSLGVSNTGSTVTQQEKKQIVQNADEPDS
jgi:serine/threonine protein kinase